MEVVLISTYELGRQPFGLASPAAWLRRAGARVTCFDLSRQPLEEELVRSADLIAFYIPMHTATRMATEILRPIRQLNPGAHLCFYGLYAPVNEGFLRMLGGETILGGEFEEGLVSLFERLRAETAASDRRVQPEPVISLARQKFIVPERGDLPPLAKYAPLVMGDGELRVVGYTEASRGCKHLCRHCPVVPVYKGQFRIVQREIVLEDIRRQVRAGAAHITFGDPDFFNGVSHALAIVEALHREHPHLTYDVTVKIEHLLKQARHLETLRETGCLFVTSAAEAVDDRILALLDKGHTRADFVRAVELCRQARLQLSPTFVAFTPWTTLEGYLELLEFLTKLDLVDQVAPIQLGIRLLIPAGSKLLELAEVRKLVGDFDEAALSYRWSHSDPRVDHLCKIVQEIVKVGEKALESRRMLFSRIWAAACQMANKPFPQIPGEDMARARAAVPYLNEPWYC